MQRRRAAWQGGSGRRGLVLIALLVSGLTAFGDGRRARADERLGVSACELMRGVPEEGHPLRKQRDFAAAFRALDAAGRDPRRAAGALKRFMRQREALLGEAARAFRTEPDGETGFEAKRAERFLAAEVLVPNGALRVGRDGFELTPGLMAGLALAACRAGDVAAVLRAARQVTGPDAASLRASAAIVGLFGGRFGPGAAMTPDALEDLTRGLEADDFTAAFALTELALRRGQREDARALHARARAFVTTVDEQEAWLRQEGRL